MLVRKIPVAPAKARVVLSVLFFLLAVPNAVLPTRTDGLRQVPFAILPHHELGAEIIERIPAEPSIAVQYDLFNLVPNRAVKLPMRLWSLDKVEYVFLDLRGRPSDLVGEEKRIEREEVYRRLFSDEFEDVIGDRDAPEETDGYLLLRRAKTTE